MDEEEYRAAMREYRLAVIALENASLSDWESFQAAHERAEAARLSYEQIRMSATDTTEEPGRSTT